MFDKNQMASLMKKAQEMQENLQKTQEEVANLEIVGEAGAGLIKISMTGKHNLKKVSIDDTLMTDKEMLEDLIVAAVNDANHKLDSASQEKMGGLAAGLPGGLGGMKFPF